MYLEIDVLRFKLWRFKRGWRVHIWSHLQRIWRNFPQSTRDPKGKAFRKRYFKEAMVIELRLLWNHELLDGLFSSEQQRERRATRAWLHCDHPQSFVRWLAASYVSHVGISSGR